jgi:outer membrane protein TolC
MLPATLILAMGASVAATQDPARPTLELTVEQAVQRALENNVDIAVEKFSPLASEAQIGGARGAYDPTFTSNWSFQSRTSEGTNAFAGATKVDSDTLNYDFSASKLLSSGGTLRADFSNDRTSTNSVFSTFNPSYNSAFQVNFTQPLLRNRKIDNARLNLQLTKRNREISDLQFRSVIVGTLSSVRRLYYDLIYAQDNLTAQQKSLELARRFLKENQIKVDVGTLAPLDVVAAESEVATREEGVLVAENSLAEAEDALRRTIFPKNDPEAWRTRIVPTDRPTADPVAADPDAALAAALQKRIDYAVAKKNLENLRSQLDLAAEGVRPGLDLVATYGTAGTGGTLITRSGFGGPIVSTIPGGYGDALKDVIGQDFPTWSLGVNFTYPLGNRAAKATEARNRIAYDQAEVSLRRLELNIASEVRSAARAVETNLKRVATTQAARTLQARRLDAEEKKFAAGMSTNFLVTQAQRDLALAEVAELRAIADYRKSVVDFERVQESGVSGGGGSISVSTGR